MRVSQLFPLLLLLLLLGLLYSLRIPWLLFGVALGLEQLV
jgi:hypothetical protein